MPTVGRDTNVVDRAIDAAGRTLMLAVEHLDPIMGIDIHIVQPPGPVPPVPIPHPYIGVVLDVMDYIPDGACELERGQCRFRSFERQILRARPDAQQPYIVFFDAFQETDEWPASSSPARRRHPPGLDVVMDLLSLLCRLAMSVPPPRYHIVKYAGVLASASPLRSRIAPVPALVAAQGDKGESARARAPSSRFRVYFETQPTVQALPVCDADARPELSERAALRPLLPVSA
jgi:hypothetical protein